MDKLKISNGPANIVQLTPEGYLLVEGIEKWILHFQPDVGLYPDSYLKLTDSNTGAEFEVRMLKRPTTIRKGKTDD